MTNKGFLFVNIMTVGHSWGFVDGNSWMAIREFVGLRGWQFVGLFVGLFVNIMTFGHSWVFVDGNS